MRQGVAAIPRWKFAGLCLIPYLTMLKKDARELTALCALALCLAFFSHPALAAPPAPEIQSPRVGKILGDYALLRREGKSCLRLLQEYGADKALSRARRDMELANMPRHVYSAIAHDAYAKNAWLLARAAALAAPHTSEPGRIALESALFTRQILAYFDLTPQEGAEMTAVTDALLTSSNKALLRVSRETANGILEGGPNDWALTLTLEDGRVLSLQRESDDGARLLNGCRPGKPCSVTFTRDEDGDFIAIVDAEAPER